MNQGYSGPNEPTIAQEQLIPPTGSPFAARKAVKPEQLIRRSATTTLSRNPVQKIVHLWHSDPAYKVFIIAIGTGIVSALVAIILVSSFFSTIFASRASVAHSSTTSGGNNAGAGNNAVAGAAATATMVPTATATSIPTPTAGIQNSLPPLSTMPIIPPTTVPVVPTPAPVVNGPLTLQITNAPATAQNGSSVPVSVTSNKPNIHVKLAVVYTVPPNNFTSGSHTTNDNGDVTINWHVGVLAFNPGGDAIIARITAVARDQNGQMVSSQTVSVQIINNG